MRSVEIVSSVELASSPDEVWRYVSDTDRVNRLVMRDAVAFRPIEEGAATSARFIATTRAGGLRLTYDELPFEWTEGRGFRVVRRMRGGLLDTYELAWSLEPSEAVDGGTRATLRLEIVPRFAVVRPVVWLQGRGMVAKLVALAGAIDAHVRDRAPSPFREPVSRANARLVDHAVKAIERAGVRPALAARLAAMVREAPDADLVRVRPFDVADAWGEPPREVLRAMLHAVPAGLLELRWSIVCPSCRTASDQATLLSDVREDGHCQLCDVTFALDLDRAVEATFVPHRAVRDVPSQMFCIGGPARTPHVVAQVNVDAGAARDLPAPREPGRYRLFARGGAVASVEVQPDAPAETPVSLREDGLRPADLRVAPSGRLRVTNETSVARHVKIERLAWATRAVTAHVLTTMPEFRRLFSADLLKRETPLKVSRVAILFSDLTGSTALYAHLGDAAAFRLVDDHFDVLRAAVERHDGVVVKTMGDAVLAAFVDAASCARAAVDALRDFERFRASRPHGHRVGLKLGMHAGPCYVVTANGRLDYFGQTVNVASRIQHLAEAGELVLARESVDALGDDERRATQEIARFEARVKGVDAPLDLVRLRLAPISPHRDGASASDAAAPPKGGDGGGATTKTHPQP